MPTTVPDLQQLQQTVTNAYTTVWPTQ